MLIHILYYYSMMQNKIIGRYISFLIWDEIGNKKIMRMNTGNLLTNKSLNNIIIHYNTIVIYFKRDTNNN